ncbi:hypothetical protein BJV78DRAFT_1223057 [Lactifluus subvellereus]|nr:hypothetical protein BJV78DRAFT_1223057 [Lactifluus subvellereus]
MSSLLPDRIRLQPALSHSAYSLAPSTPTSSGDLQLIPPKSERRISLGVLDSAKFRLSHDFARLVRSPSSVSSKSTQTGRTASTHGSRAVASDYENEPHPGLPHPPVDFDHHDMLPLFSDLSPNLSPFYGFLSHSSSHSRSRSRGGTHPSDSPSNGSPDPQNAATITIASTSGTSDSHCASLPTSDPSTSRLRSPPRPLSGNTTTTGDTVTPRTVHSRAARAGRPPHPAQPIPHLINDSGIGVDEALIRYDPRMPPPPVPTSTSGTQPTQTKEKRRSKPFFGLPAAPWSHPTIPKDEERPALPPPSHGHPNRPSKVSKIESWFKFGTPPSAVASSSRTAIAAPQLHPPTASPSIPEDPAYVTLRPHSTPPRVHASAIESSDSERDGRCSPLLGLFTSARGRGKQREHSHNRSYSGKPVVGAPITRTRTASRDGPNVVKGAGGAHLPSFEFENPDVRRSASHTGYRRVASPHANANGHVHSHAHRSRGHAHTNSHGQDARPRTHTHARSHSHAHPARSQTHPQPSQHRGAASPHSAHHSPLMHPVTGASAASQSTTGTNTTNGGPVTGGTGSWGRVGRTVDWVRGAGVHPPFAFERATSSTASATGERRGGGGGGGTGSGSGSDIRERERDRDRERSRRHVARPQAPAAPASPRKSAGTGPGLGPGRWEQREVELGLGLTWAPSKIRVREWAPDRASAGAANVDDDARAQALRREREMEQRVREREGARRTRERLAEYELGYAHSRSRKDKEVTGRFREVLGAEGFEAFKKYVRRFDADIIPLEGSSGLLGRVERLLDRAPTRHVSTREKRELLDDLLGIVRENEW